MYDDNQELLLYKKDYLIIVPGTDFNMNELLEQAIYHLTGIQINSDNVVDLIATKNYIKENHSINGKLKFIYKELRREYYSYYLGDSRIYPYEFNALGEFTKISLEQLLKEQYNPFFPVLNELSKRLTYQKY